MWTIHTTFLAPAQGHFEVSHDKDGREKKTFVFDVPPQMTTRDMRLSLTEDKAVEIVKRWNNENGNTVGMKPSYFAVLIRD